MELQVGKKYRRRDGKVVEIARFNSKSRYAYESANATWTWTKEGLWNTESSNHPYDLIEEVVEDDKTDESFSGDKYKRPIKVVGIVDVYDFLDAFDVTCPARQHAIKKLLCAGIRGKGDVLQDLSEAKDAVQRAIELEKGRQK